MHSTKNTSRHTQKNGAPKNLIPLALKLPSCKLVVLIDGNTYILTEGRKTVLKENYAIALDSCYILTKNC